VLRLAYGIDPNALSDAEWAKRFEEWRFVEDYKAKHLAAHIAHAVGEVAIEILNQLNTSK
jgi:hypothetical protein